MLRDLSIFVLGELVVLLTFYRLFPKRDYISLGDNPTEGLVLAIGASRMVLSFALFACIVGGLSAVDGASLKVLYLSAMSALLTSIAISDRSPYAVVMFWGAASDVAAFSVLKFT